MAGACTIMWMYPSGGFTEKKLTRGSVGSKASANIEIISLGPDTLSQSLAWLRSNNVGVLGLRKSMSLNTVSHQ